MAAKEATGEVTLGQENDHPHPATTEASPTLAQSDPLPTIHYADLRITQILLDTTKRCWKTKVDWTGLLI